MVTLVAVDKVYADFIVHSFITTELCFYEHYLYVPHLEKCFVVFLFSTCQARFITVLYEIVSAFSQKPSLPKPIRSFDLFEYST